MKIENIKQLCEELKLPYQEWRWVEVPEKGYTMSTYPRAIIFPFVYDGVRASGSTYKKTLRFQTSIESKHPAEPIVFQLEDKLIEQGINVEIYQEFIKDDDIFHYYFALNGER